MGFFVVRRRLDDEVTRRLINDIRKFFKDNPRRRVCRTDLYFQVRRGHIVEDIIQHSEHPENFEEEK